MIELPVLGKLASYKVTVELKKKQNKKKKRFNNQSLLVSGYNRGMEDRVLPVYWYRPLWFDLLSVHGRRGATAVGATAGHKSGAQNEDNRCRGNTGIDGKDVGWITFA